MRIVHCGDVHLGSGRQVHADRYDDLFRVFDEVLTVAREPSVDMLLISGDLFDTKEPDVETLARAVKHFAELHADRPELQVLAIEGNHDMRKGARGLFQNRKGVLDVLGDAGFLTLLRPRDEEDALDWSRAVHHVPDSDVSVLGVGYWRTQTAERFTEAMDFVRAHLADRRVIVLAHMMLAFGDHDAYHGSARAEDVLPLPENVIYVGLGHGHGRVVPGDSRHHGVFYSPGSLEFVHRRNTHRPVDTRGYFDVAIPDGADRSAVEATHRPTITKRPFVHLDLALTPEVAVSFDAVRDLTVSQLREAVPPSDLHPICSVRFTGAIGFAAASFRSSQIELDLKRELSALQVFVERHGLTNARGESIEVDVRDGYEDALHGVLADKLADARDELGLPEDEPVVLRLLEDALKQGKHCGETLDAIAERLAHHRAPASRALTVRVDVTALRADQVPARAVAAVTAADNTEGARLAGVRVKLHGRPPVDEERLPEVLDLDAIQAQVQALPGTGPVSVEVGPEVYAFDTLVSVGGAR